MEVTTFDQNPPCTKINSHGCDIYFMRHAQSLANAGCEWLLDSPLSEEGIRQAKLVEGNFNLVICSPCRRTLETLHHSKITYDQLMIHMKCREMVQTPTSQLLLEQRNQPFICEDINDFWKRAFEFQQELEFYCSQYEEKNIKAKVLIVSHGFFFNAWYRKGCYATPMNAHLFRIV